MAIVYGEKEGDDTIATSGKAGDTMSANLEVSDGMMRCAGCGMEGIINIWQLQECDACKSVLYCSDYCQEERRPKHKRTCEKRAAELRLRQVSTPDGKCPICVLPLSSIDMSESTMICRGCNYASYLRAPEIRDDILFKQPEETDLGDCPICIIPMIHSNNCNLMSCCSKLICDGCELSNQVREFELKMKPTCPFCRQRRAITHTKGPFGDELFEKNMMKRVEANDPVALREVGMKRYNEGDYDGAFQYYKKAIELGDIDAHFKLSIMYLDHKGKGGELKDEKKAVYHLEEAAIGGHSRARHNLGAIEWNSGRRERAAKHFIIAANLGYDDSMDQLKLCYRMGVISKDNYAAALRAHQAAVDATKSPQREATLISEHTVEGFYKLMRTG